MQYGKRGSNETVASGITQPKTPGQLYLAPVSFPRGKMQG